MIIIEQIVSHLSSPPLLIPSLLLCPPEQEQARSIRSTNHHNGHFQDDDQTQMCEFALGPTVAAWAIVRQMKPDQTSRNIVFICKVKWRQCVFPLGFAHCFHFSVARNDILKPFTLVLVIPFCTNWQLKSYCWFKVVYWLRGRHDGTGGYHVGVPRPLVVVTLLSGICQGQLLMLHMFGGLHWIPTIKTVQCPLKRFVEAYFSTRLGF